ncbi:phosphoribosylglycinamide formyltransferase [bacterium]|nr:phosphoribosylglycinamide formyltransferase [bacterium]
MSRLRIGVLASGRGSNLGAILDRSLAGDIDVEVALVVSDVESAAALDRARAAGVPALYIPPGRFRTKLDPEAERSYIAKLKDRGVELVALAGFMRILHNDFLAAFPGAVINIHPSLLPAFPGLDVQRKAIEYGVKWSGATVHFVDAGVDSGPIIMQTAVPVLDDDTPDTLAARILREEHKIYPQALQLIAERRVAIAGRRILTREPPGNAS